MKCASLVSAKLTLALLRRLELLALRLRILPKLSTFFLFDLAVQKDPFDVYTKHKTNYLIKVPAPKY